MRMGTIQSITSYRFFIDSHIILFVDKIHSHIILFVDRIHGVA